MESDEKESLSSDNEETSEPVENNGTSTASSEVASTTAAPTEAIEATEEAKNISSSVEQYVFEFIKMLQITQFKYTTAIPKCILF